MGVGFGVGARVVVGNGSVEEDTIGAGVPPIDDGVGLSVGSVGGDVVAGAGVPIDDGVGLGETTGVRLGGCGVIAIEGVEGGVAVASDSLEKLGGADVACAGVGAMTCPVVDCEAVAVAVAVVRVTVSVGGVPGRNKQPHVVHSANGELSVH